MTVNKQYKSVIIRKYGTDVEILKYLQGTELISVPTKVLLGRSVRSNSDIFKTATQKEGIFLPKEDVRSGDYVCNKHHTEFYIIVGTHQEYDGNNHLSIVASLLKCEHFLTVRRLTEVVDSRGNIKTDFEKVYERVPCFVEYVSGELRQYEPGLNAETEFKVYISALDFNENDQLLLTSVGVDDEAHTALAINRSSFPGMLILEMKRDTVRG